MTKVDFYVLPAADPAARLTFACKLSEKAWRMGHRIYLHCADQAQLDALDARLWTFKAETFLPHDVVGQSADTPIVLGLDAQLAGHEDLLINLSLSVPESFNRFARVAELVIEEPQSRQAARDNFRFYRDGGYALQNHKLTHL